METTIKKNPFLLVMRKTLIEKKKTYIYTVGAIIGACALVGLWFGMLGGQPDMSTAITYMLIGGFVLGYAASKMFADMANKQTRIAALMTPASAAAKFWPRFIIVLPCMLIVAVAGWYVLNYSMLLACKFSSGYWGAVYVPHIFSADVNIWDLAAITSLFLFNESVFMVGAIAWPKKSFIKTMILFAAINFALSYSMVYIMKHLDYQIFLNISEDALSMTITAICTVVDCALIYLSYRLFKRATLNKV